LRTSKFPEKKRKSSIIFHELIIKEIRIVKNNPEVSESEFLRIARALLEKCFKVPGDPPNHSKES